MVCEIRIFCLTILALLLPAIAVAQAPPSISFRAQSKLSDSVQSSDSLCLSAQGLQQSAVMLKARNLQTRYLRGIIQTAQPYRFAPPPPALEMLHFGCVHDATLQGQTLD